MEMVLDLRSDPVTAASDRQERDPLSTRRGHPDPRTAEIDHVTMVELTSSPVLAHSVDRDLASTQGAPHVTTRVDQAGELHQLAQADHGTGDLDNDLGRLTAWIAGHHQTVP
jgi:hypothetical protein